MFTGLGLMGGHLGPTMLTVGHASYCLDAKRSVMLLSLSFRLSFNFSQKSFEMSGIPSLKFT